MASFHGFFTTPPEFISRIRIPWTIGTTVLLAAAILVIAGLTATLADQSPRDHCPGHQQLVTIEQTNGSFIFPGFQYGSVQLMHQMPLEYKHAVLGFKDYPNQWEEIRVYDVGEEPYPLGLLSIPELGEQQCSVSSEQRFTREDPHATGSPPFTFGLDLKVTVSWIE